MRKTSYDIRYRFVNEFIVDVVDGKDPTYIEKINKLYLDLCNDKSTLNITDFGAGSVSGNGKFRKVGMFVKNSSVRSKYGRFLARLVTFLRPSVIIELGTGAGISTLYMALANEGSMIYSIEGSPEIAGLARSNLDRLGAKNTRLITGSFSQKLPEILPLIQNPLLVFIDGDHRGECLLEYYKTILPWTAENTVIILDDIRWSESMEEAWIDITRQKEVSVSLDLFRLGILFFKKNIDKQHFVVKF